MLKTKSVLLMMVGWAACSAFGALTYINWTGGAGVENGVYQFANPANWEGGVVPYGLDSVPVFNVEGDITVFLGKADGFSYATPAGLRVERGNVRLTAYELNGDGTTKSDSIIGQYLYFNALDIECYVAQDALLTVETIISMWQKNKSTFRKTGGGQMTVRSLAEGKDGYAGLIEVSAGILRSVKKPAAFIAANRISIASGATLWVDSYHVLGSGQYPRADIFIAEGGVLRLDGGEGENSIGCLEGAGTISDMNYWSKLNIVPTRDCVFSGTLARGANHGVSVYVNNGSEGRLILGNPAALDQAYEVAGSAKLAFAPCAEGYYSLGTGHSSAKGFLCDADVPLTLSDTNGSPVEVAVKLSGAVNSIPVLSRFIATGPGTLRTVENVTLANGQLKALGALRVGAQTLTLGTGAAESDVDFSEIGAIDVLQGTTLIINNAADTTVACPVTGAGIVKGCGNVTFGNFALINGTGRSAGAVTVTDGVARLKEFTFDSSAPYTLTWSGGVLSAMTWQPMLGGATASQALIPGDVPVYGSMDATLRVTGGDVHLYGQGSSGGLGRIEVTGGRVLTGTRLVPAVGATAENPAVLRLDGGELAVKVNTGSGVVYNYSPLPTLATRRFEVGPKGGTIAQAYIGSSTKYYGIACTLAQSVESCEGGKDGGLRQFGFLPWIFTVPMTFNGPYVAEGCASIIARGVDLAAAPHFFGNGSMTLRNHRLQFEPRAETATLAVPGAGQTLTVEGGVLLEARPVGDTTVGSPAPMTLALENLAFQNGGVLFLRDCNGPVGEAGNARITCATPPEKHAENGRVFAPIIGTTRNQDATYFVSYDSEKGFCAVEPTRVQDLGAVTEKMVVDLNKNSSGWTQIGAGQERAVDALKLCMYVSLDLNKNARLKIGDGVHPGLLVFCGSYVTGATGALDFGTSPAYVCVRHTRDEKNPAAANRLGTPIVAANGVHYAGEPYLADGMKFIALEAANTYSGATYIGGVGVVATNTQCFSQGPVYLTGGETFGGSVLFAVPGGTWANNFIASGRGVRWSQWEEKHCTGAMSFTYDGTVQGNVTLVREVRVAAYPGATGVFTGVISGDRLQVFQSDGVIRLAAANTYSGGTEVALGTLELAQTGAAGTGPVRLDNGTLRFVNTAPLVFDNALEPGSRGRVEICGAPVTFTHPSWTAELPYASVAAGTAFELADPLAGNWVPYVTDVFDLGGKDVTLKGLAGSGRVTGGVVTITGTINPGGAGVIGTLTFETAPVFVAGAVYQCDCTAATADKIVLPDGFDLSSLALETSTRAKPKWANATIVETEGAALTGVFAATTHKSYKYGVAYRGATVVLTRPGFVVSVR